MQDRDVDPWTVYWQADHLDSCIPADSGADGRAMDALWEDFARELEADAAVLDLATGNGAVPVRLLRTRPALRITAVDRADIRPAEFLADAPALTRVNFIGATDVAALPFDDGCFAAVTSQYGIEYGDSRAAVREARRVLADGGRLRLLTHHADGAVLAPVPGKLEELGALLVPGGVVDGINALVEGRLTPAELELAGQAYLRREHAKTRQLSGQVFDGINVILKQLAADRDGAAGLARRLRFRMQAEVARLEQMQSAALDAAAAQALATAIRDAGFVLTVFDQCRVGSAAGEPALVGWLYDAAC